MDKRRGVVNIGVSLLSRALLLVAALFMRRLIILYLGDGINGLNSLYASIISMLAVAELGVGGAIAFSMYRPIVEGDCHRVAMLYGLYKRIYLGVGVVVFLLGLCMIPVLPALIGDHAVLNVDLSVTFLLTLIATVITYFYGAKTALVEAYKNNYVTTIILTVSRLFAYGLQVVAILIWSSYIGYLFCQIAGMLVAWGMTEAVAGRMHGDVLSMHELTDRATADEVARNVRAMFMHKVGSILVTSVDSTIISAFVGVVALGRFSNYSLLAGALSGTISLVFSSLTSVVGHLCASDDAGETKRWFDRLWCLNYALGVVCFLGFFAVIDGAVSLFFGPGQRMPRVVAAIVTLNQFVQFMRRTQLLFRDASGTFWNDRWKPVVEGVANLTLSLVLVNVLPEDLRVTGVIMATVASTLVICDIVEPYVVFRYALDSSPVRFYLRSYTSMGLFGVLLALLTRLTEPARDLAGMGANGLLSLAVSAAGLGLVATLDRGFRRNLGYFARRVSALPQRFGGTS